MKKYWLVLFALTLVTAMFAYEVVAYSEDFETGATGWTHYDGAVSPNNWHIYNYGGTQGNCWWMGDPALASGTGIGGYYSHQYLVLDTPARALTAANATLTFKLRYYVEDPAGAEAPYTGWDACNVRISTDGGTVWTPISGTPTYNVTSAYSFGFEHGEGPNIPGWGGNLTTWTNATFNLSAYVGQNVKIRFAFASDPAYDTSDAPAMFGMMVDDIAFGGYSNNGTDDGQMTWSSLVPLGGDIWSIATEATAPSPTHVMKNQNNAGTYNVNMLNYLVSPSITLPADGAIRCDYMIKGSFSDPNTFPDVDYYGWEISPDNGTTWNAMSNPYGSATGSNYVYSDAPTDWASMTESYTLDGLITDFHGQTVKFRWYFQSDADTPSGTGIMIDDFKIYNDIVVAAPESLEATVAGSNVTLNWNAPGSGGGGGQEGWINYDGENSDSIGTGAAADFDVAAKWDATGTTNSIYPYVGMNITKIQFYPNEASCTYAVRLWTGATHTQVLDQAVTNPTIGAWNEVILTTPFTIPAGTEIMAGYRCNTTTGYPAGCDAGPQVEGYGNMMRFQGTWTTLTALAATLTYNWNIRVYVADAAGREYVLGELPQNEQFATGTLAASGIINQTRDREVTAYKIYRDGTSVGQVAGTVLTYTDTNVTGGVHSYTVTAMYGANESTASNAVSVFVLPAQHAELFHDDGTAEQGYTVGSTKHMGVKYTYPGSVNVKWVKVYVHTPGTAGIIVRIFDNDGTDGLPGTQMAQYQYPATSVTQGWNFITLPTEVTVADGSFYLAILETVNAAQIGLDTSSHGYSYKKIGTAWEPINEGEVMIRALVYTGSANDDETTPELVLDAANFPNPFNPTTTISFSLPESGLTTLNIYNLKGQLVRSLVNGDMASGKQNIVWNGLDNSNRPVASGVYFYKVNNGGKSIIRKMLLSK